MMSDADMVGDILRRIAQATMVTVRRGDSHDDGYTLKTRGKTLHADCINLQGAASGLAPDSTLEYGGDREKRITLTETSTGTKYLYIEVGGRE